jgi:hypothetical protein
MQSRIDALKERLRSETTTPFDAAAELRVLARPRMTGSDGAAEVEAALRARLAGLGYDVRDLPFSFSTWPGRYGLAAAGVVLVLTGVFSGIFLLSGNPTPSLVVLVLGFAAIATGATLAGGAVMTLRWGRRSTVNLLATRGDARPRYLIMAHRDSKSQPVPLVLRFPAILVAGLTWAALVVVSFLSIVQPTPETLTFVLALLAVLAGTVLALCWASDDSPGALDNASGVAALIGIAEREAEHGDIAFLVTDAEELGLAGARAMAGRLPPIFGVINLDGLDDEGPFYVLERFGWPARGTAPHLALALLSAAAALDIDATRRDVPPGILLDHMPIVRTGTAALSIMRGQRRSLARVHRPGDDLLHLRGDGVSRCVTLVSTALRILREGEPGGAQRVAPPSEPG